MKKQLYFLLLLLLTLPHCKKDDSNDLSIRFFAKFGNEKFNLNQIYEDEKGYKYRFESFRFFISNLTLVKEDNSEVLLKDVACIDFEKPLSLELKFPSVATENFKKIKFGIGLTPQQNDVLPDDAPENDPRHLYANQMYWGWLKYIFVRIDGRSDVDGSGKFQNLLIYHIGTDELYRTVVLDKKFNNENKQNITMNIDLKKIFRQVGNEIDISNYERSYTHSDKTNQKNFDTAIMFADNFSKSFSIE
ncbi:MAG: hypothetical protein NZ522_03330 [Chitinophagales bacterium]|nr:hypothetical protein [Chitinophagales bacterium]